MKKNLNDYVTELQSLSFDIRKIKGLVKKANKDGYDIYYAYHEDGEDTWKRGWSESDYKEKESDVKIFEATELVRKNKKATRAFTKAQTYTAECAIFVFCPLRQILEDKELREWKINNVKNKAAKYAIADYESFVARKMEFDKWRQLPEENKIEIIKLNSETFPNAGQPGTAKLHEQYKREKAQKIKELGGLPVVLGDWQKEAAAFESVEKFIIYRQEKAVAILLQEAEETPED